MWEYSRVDHLTPQAVCLFCNRPLRALKGIVISDGAQEAYAGPNCARRMLGAPEERLLDVARLALLVVSEEDPDVELGSREGLLSDPQSGFRRPSLVSTTSVERPSLPALDRVIQYLRLRYEFMQEFHLHKSKLLTEAYEAYRRTGQLDEATRKRVAGMIRNAGEQKTVFSEANIKHCIGLNHWLHEAVQHTQPERRVFLEAMVAKLHRRWTLTPGQLNGINSWGIGLRKQVHTFPHLDAHIFDGVHVPDFMSSASNGQNTR